MHEFGVFNSKAADLHNAAAAQKFKTASRLIR